MDELAKRETQALVDPKTQRPRGYENFEEEDLIVPRIAIAQSMSKVVQNGDVRLGSLYNTLTMEAYTKDNQPYIEILVVRYTKSRRLWNPENKDDSMCMSENGRVSQAGDVCRGECPHMRSVVAREPGVNADETSAYEWSEDAKGKRLAPACTLYNNYLALTEPFDRCMFPCVVSLGKTAAKAAKQFNSLIMASGEDIYARIYTIVTEKKENAKGSFFVPKIRSLRKVDQAEYVNAGLMATKLALATYKIHEEENENASTDGQGTDDSIPF